MSFISISLDASEIAATKKALGQVFDNKGLTTILKAALTKATEPGLQRLIELSPVGPTGNLKRAAAKKIVGYPKNGGAVGLVGYRQSGKGESRSAAGGSVRAGKDRAFHQWWIEFGTKPRNITTKSNTPYQRRAHTRRMKSGKVASISSHVVSGQNAYIASSFNKLGAFKFVDRATTDPPYPYAFFKKSSQPIRLPGVPAGGISGVPPLRTAYEQTRGIMGEILSRELSISLEAALSRIARSSTGTVTGAVIQAGG